MSSWLIYRGDGRPHDGITRLPPPPPWRTFADIKTTPAARDEAGWSKADLARAASYRAESPDHGGATNGQGPAPDDERQKILNPVNAALYLRRPLLVTGKPGVGKSTLAYSVAYELGLGPVLRWSITSSSSLKDGLYRYDAIGRLQDVNLKLAETDPDIGRYLRLGPLGTALLAQNTPRVLLIDEIDKANIDLPNDLLSMFEEGQYEIPELVRIAERRPLVDVPTADDGTVPVRIEKGRVQCCQFPFVVMTSNSEREFPGAFLRRCLRLDIDPPGFEQLVTIVDAQLGPEVSERARDLISDFVIKGQNGDLATDQLLNAIHLTCGNGLEPAERVKLRALLLRYLNSAS